MYNSFINRWALCAVIVLTALVGSASSNELRITSVSMAGGYGTVEVAGLQSAVSNGCPWLSLAFCDSLGGHSIWPGGYQWRTDYRAISLHQFDASKNYQRFSGANFWKPVCRDNAMELATTVAGPSFAPGDASGYVLVSNVAHEAAYRVYRGISRDGVFTYNDMYAPHWLVWSTNGGARWESGWHWTNVRIETNDTFTFTGIPAKWAICTRAAELVRLDDFALLPGTLGGLPPFYIALTETTEDTAAAAISNGVALGLCTSTAFTPSVGRGAMYPDTGRALGEVLALCNLATRLHNAVTGESLSVVYTVGGSAFYSPVSNTLSVVRNETATGYRLPTIAEFAYATAGDDRSDYPWGGAVSHEWFVTTNGLQVTESVISTGAEDRALRLKYHSVTTNSTANFVTRNGSRHVSPARVAAVRSQFQSWSIPVVNSETGFPVVRLTGGMAFPMYFGDTSSDGAWGIGTRQVHDLAGNVGEMAWPPVARPWGGARVCVMGGSPSFDAAYARSDSRSFCSADRGRLTVGFRFARNKLEVQ